MRAVDILLFCLCLNAAITFIDVSGFGTVLSGHPTGFMMAAKGELFSQNLTGMNAFSNPATATGGDMFMVAASWVIETTFVAIGFILSAILIIPALMDVFYFPVYVAVMLQGLLYMVYFWAYVQWKSGKSLYSYW